MSNCKFFKDMLIKAKDQLKFHKRFEGGIIVKDPILEIEYSYCKEQDMLMVRKNRSD